MSFLVLLILMGALYAFMIVPQQRKMKAHNALLRSLEEGDVVVTSAGIYGAIVEVEDEVVWLEVAPDIELKVLRSAIADRVEEADEVDDDHDEDDDIEDDDLEDDDLDAIEEVD